MTTIDKVAALMVKRARNPFLEFAYPHEQPQAMGQGSPDYLSMLQQFLEAGGQQQQNTQQPASAEEPATGGWWDRTKDIAAGAVSSLTPGYAATQGINLLRGVVPAGVGRVWAPLGFALEGMRWANHYTPDWVKKVRHYAMPGSRALDAIVGDYQADPQAFTESTTIDPSKGFYQGIVQPHVEAMSSPTRSLWRIGQTMSPGNLVNHAQTTYNNWQTGRQLQQASQARQQAQQTAQGFSRDQMNLMGQGNAGYYFDNRHNQYMPTAETFYQEGTGQVPAHVQTWRQRVLNSAPGWKPQQQQPVANVPKPPEAPKPAAVPKPPALNNQPG
jgi:hypothetical protein